MNAQWPIRDEARQRAEASDLYFRGRLPPGWTCDQPRDDYGVDLRVGIVEDGRVTGREFLVQLKSTQDSSTPRAFETVQLKVSTYNLLINALSVAMVVKYIADEDEAYWMLLRDATPPPQTQKSFTVRIPRAQPLSQIDWEAVQRRIFQIHHLKLGAGRDGYR